MLYGRLTVNPVSAAWNTAAWNTAAWNTAARYHDYTGAQRAVERVRVMLGSAGLLPADPR